MITHKIQVGNETGKLSDPDFLPEWRLPKQALQNKKGNHWHLVNRDPTGWSCSGQRLNCCDSDNQAGKLLRAKCQQKHGKCVTPPMLKQLPTLAPLYCSPLPGETRLGQWQSSWMAPPEGLNFPSCLAVPSHPSSLTPSFRTTLSRHHICFPPSPWGETPASPLLSTPSHDCVGVSKTPWWNKWAKTVLRGQVMVRGWFTWTHWHPQGLLSSSHSCLMLSMEFQQWRVYWASLNFPEAWEYFSQWYLTQILKVKGAETLVLLKHLKND